MNNRVVAVGSVAILVIPQARVFPHDEIKKTVHVPHQLRGYTWRRVEQPVAAVRPDLRDEDGTADEFGWVGQVLIDPVEAGDRSPDHEGILHDDGGCRRGNPVCLEQLARLAGVGVAGDGAVFGQDLWGRLRVCKVRGEEAVEDGQQHLGLRQALDLGCNRLEFGVAGDGFVDERGRVPDAAAEDKSFSDPGALTDDFEYGL